MVGGMGWGDGERQARGWFSSWVLMYISVFVVKIHSAEH